MRPVILALFPAFFSFAQEAPKPAEVKPSLTAEQILDKAAAAVADPASREKIKTNFMKSDIELGPQGIRGTLETYWKAPNKRLTITRIEGGTETRQGYDGQSAWVKDQAGAVTDVTGPQLAIVQRTALLHADANWRTVYDKVELQSTGKVGGRDAYVLKLTPKAGPPLLRYYDADTFLLIRSDMTAGAPQSDFIVKSTFSDYRDVDGMKFAFQVSQQLKMGAAVSRIIELKNNVPIDDAIFVKPPDTSATAPKVP